MSASPDYVFFFCCVFSSPPAFCVDCCSHGNVVTVSFRSVSVTVIMELLSVLRMWIIWHFPPLHWSRHVKWEETWKLWTEETAPSVSQLTDLQSSQFTVGVRRVRLMLHVFTRLRSILHSLHVVIWSERCGWINESDTMNPSESCSQRMPEHHVEPYSSPLLIWPHSSLTSNTVTLLAEKRGARWWKWLENVFELIII